MNQRQPKPPPTSPAIPPVPPPTHRHAPSAGAPHDTPAPEPPTAADPARSDRDQALAHHAAFCSRVLPVMLRRFAAWKGISPQARRDLGDELRQEVALDCLTHTDVVARLCPRDRHQRWMRLAERHAYQTYLRPERRRQRDQHPDGTPSQPWAYPYELPDRASQVAEGLAGNVHKFGNGRISLKRTGSELGVSAKEVRKSWDYLAVQLGYGGDYRQFWLRRFTEALVGLAADRLRDERAVWVQGEHGRRRPDPDGRALRIRRIKAMMQQVPLREPLRSILARVTAPGAQWRLTPAALLADADTLDPANPTLLLWRFEAASVEGDLPQAVSCLRRAQHCGADPIRVALGRARIQEMRGRPTHGAAMLRRAAERHPLDPRLRDALRHLGNGPADEP